MMTSPVLLDLIRAVSDAASSSLFAAIWQGALLAGAAALGLRLLPRTPAAARFAIWFAVFLLVAALPVVALWGHPAPAAMASSRTPWLTLDPRWSEGILALWAVASLVRGITLLIAGFRVRALWRRAAPLEAASWPGLEAAAPGRTVQICTSDEIDRPSVIGFWAPKILIPSWLVDKLTPEEMAHVILHEAGHLRRADDWLNLLQKFALVVFPLNPALVWVERRLCFERELACDERVLRATGAPKAYASCLTSLAEHRMSRRGIALVMGALGRESELGQRVLRILSRGERMRPMQARLVMASACLALIAGAAELERVPQLVGFANSAPAAQSAALARYQPAKNALPRAAYQEVVFHPQPATAQQRSPLGVPAPAAVKHPAAPRALHATGPSTLRTAESGHLQNRWMIMTSTTSWSGNGALVMTSIQTSAPQSRRAAGLRDDGSARFDQNQRQPQVQQFYPYAAAVPVRGGWLIIQL